jgi:hypothetical protein
MRRYALLLALLVAGLFALPAACGGDDSNNGDGGGDGTIGDSPINGDGGPVSDGNGSDSSLFSDGNPNCTPLGNTCKVASDCCSGNCANGACQPPPCTADNQACTTNAQCCGGTCGSNGTCTPLNTSCKTLGNPCTSGGQCCSSFCANGICSQPSYCGQNGDVCASGSDCCGGVCTKQQNQTLGICGQPNSGGCTIDGMLCGGSGTDGGAVYTDGGLPQCGGNCCSRDCAPWGATKVLICQPASGCHPVGDICTSNNDCCGGLNGGKKDAGVTTCVKNGNVGVCSNPTGCKPNGDICRLQANQCNATDDCCSGNVQQNDTCKQDNLGVPRCSYAGDAGCIPVDAGTQCASSADCCNLDPCVPDGDGGFTCYPGVCVPISGNCTTDGDCCPGGHCYGNKCYPNTPDGGTVDSGTPDAGPCSLYGQTCTTSSDCCNNIPCTNGRCEIPVN